MSEACTSLCMKHISKSFFACLQLGSLKRSTGSTFGPIDVEKTSAVVARSTLPSPNAKKHERFGWRDEEIEDWKKDK